MQVNEGRESRLKTREENNIKKAENDRYRYIRERWRVKYDKERCEFFRTVSEE